MAELKTKKTQASVEEFLNSVPDEKKRADSFELLELFKKITGEEPKMWGTSIIGYGQYHYKSKHSKQEGDWMVTGFSPRKQNLTLYVMPQVGDVNDLLLKLGKHKISGGCLYINKLDDINMNFLEEVLVKCYKATKEKVTANDNPLTIYS